MSVWTRNRIEVELDDGGVAVVTLHGEHETYGALELERRLTSLIGRGRGLVVDLTPATFLDSAVLGALLRARTRAERKGTGLVLVLDRGGERPIPRIFEITGLLRAFRTVDTREAAVDALSRSLVPA